MGELLFPEYGASLRWHETGKGCPLVILPALSVPVMSAFEAMIGNPVLGDRRFILIDYLGSGSSDHPTGFDYSLAAHAGTVAAVMDILGLEGADVLGHSMGGSVAIQLALDHPRRVGRLAVAEGNLAPGGGAASSRIARQDRKEFLSGGLPVLQERMREIGAGWLAEAWDTADPAGVWGNADALVRLDPAFREAFLSLQVPRSFIFGERSLAEGPAPDVPDPDGLRAAGIAVVVVPLAGHGMFRDNPSGSACAVAEAFPLG